MIDQWRQLRGRLSALAWPNGYPGAKMPETVSLNFPITYNGVNDPNALQNGDNLSIRLPGTSAASANVEIVHPLVWNGKAVIVHGGHDEDFFYGLDVYSGAQNLGTLCRALTANGYMIIGCAQPFYAQNALDIAFPGGIDLFAYEPVPATVYPRIGHYQLHLVEQLLSVSALPYFVEPAIVGMNYVQATYGVKEFAMTGISGGGWTTDFVAALDTRITRSYPALGSVPFPDWAAFGVTFADFESNESCAWYQTVETMENLYTLSCIDPGRRCIKVLEDGDTVWHAANAHAEIAAFKATVQARVPAGQYDVYVGNIVQTHCYSMGAIAMILDDLKRPAS
jgi:hypothetical protein